MRFKALVNDEWVEIDKTDLEENVLVFKSFGDGEHSLTVDFMLRRLTVRFDLIEVDSVSVLTGYPSKKKRVFINKDDLDFEFVAESDDIDQQG